MNIHSLLAAAAMSLVAAVPAEASGTLTPKGSPDRTIQILDHHVEVVLNNGFARTEVSQVFFNPNAQDLEAIYSFPVPRSASLAEMTIWAGESEIHGEVIEKERARRLYESERDQGRDAGLAEKNKFYSFDFAVARVPAQAETRFRFVYYQPLEIDTGVGRYLYPLEDGGTDEAAKGFWDREEKVQRSFSMHVDLKSAWPIEAVRMPGFEAAANITSTEPGRWEVQLDQPGGSLEQDIVLYYRLADDLPGRIEVIPYRESPDGPGTFMMVVTPGIDLPPLRRGADWTFILDTSGSMTGKLHTLAAGVEQALGELRPEDRYRVITFSNSAHDLTGGFRPVNPESVARTLRKVETLGASGGTNLYEGLGLGLRDLDDDRATSVILVTDGVTNKGFVDSTKFAELMGRYDVRVFGFLLGNGANWPLMRTICDASGGFYSGVSNADDLLGQMLLAKSKMTHECLHDATLKIDGGKVHDTSPALRGKVYRGQQLVMFGRYDEAGEARVRLEARMSGEDRVYETTFDFPAVDQDHPELERLWALDQIEQIEIARNRGTMPSGEASSAIADLGVAYQLVTDETSMVVMEDASFETEQIDRSNRDRVARERQAQSRRAAQPVRSHRVDRSYPAFPSTAPRVGGKGGGALDPGSLLAALGLLVSLGWLARRGRML